MGCLLGHQHGNLGGHAHSHQHHPIKGGGNYLSVSTALANTEQGIRRDLGTVKNSSYTVTFDWRLDSATTNFTAFEDRIHIGTNATGAFGTNEYWGWSIGVAATTSGSKWYFYDTNTATDATPGSGVNANGNGTFDAPNMRISPFTLTTGTIYSFIITVNPATRTYDASITDGISTYAQTGMDFRNQSAAGNTHNNLVFGGATNGIDDGLTWSLDNLNIVPEPSSMLLAAASGLLCFVRRRIAH